MNQGEIIITYRVDSSGAITAMSNVQKKMHESERNLNSTQSKYGKFFDGLNQGFGGVANTIKKFGIVAAGVIGGGTFGAKQFIDLASGLQTTQAQMASLTGSTEAANKVFGQLYNQVLGKPIAFPDASKAASTLLGYGRTAQQVIPDLDTSDIDYTDTDGGEMIRQRLSTYTQSINGLILPKDSGFWKLYSMISSFFAANHTFTLVYGKRDGQLFAIKGAWRSSGLDLPVPADEGNTTFSTEFKVGNSVLFEYSEDSSGHEVYSNNVKLGRVSAATGGEVWDGKGQVFDAVGEVWAGASGGLSSVFVSSTIKVYPVWVLQGPAVNPSIQNNTTDTSATYRGSISSTQTLVVDFSTGEARLNGAIVSRNVIGQLSIAPGNNLVGFDVEGGEATTSELEWNNVIG